MTTIAPERPQVAAKPRIIDADTHLTEPHDLWTRRAPPSLRDRVPQVKMLNGERSWVIEGDRCIGRRAFPNSSILKDGTKVRQFKRFLSLQLEDVHPGSSQVKARLQAMDQMGVAAQIVYPNILGFGGQGAFTVEPKLRLASIQIYNDAMAEMQEESGQRLFPMALLPWWDLDEAVRETERAHAMGLRGININSDPHIHKGEDGQNLPDLSSRYWDRLWEVCQDKDLPINFHIGASEQAIDWMGHQGWPSLDHDLRATIGGAMLFLNNGCVASNIILSGLLDRFPRLQFVSVESGVGWIPFMMEALRYQLVEIAEDRNFELTPAEYFRRNFHACFWFETEDISAILRRVGIDNVLFETDFPHPTSLYPIDDLDVRLAGLTGEERAKVLGGNAAGLYRIP
jgi:predicted TIM-barrel fold metal-dependent hydrolase